MVAPYEWLDRHSNFIGINAVHPSREAAWRAIRNRQGANWRKPWIWQKREVDMLMAML